MLEHGHITCEYAIWVQTVCLLHAIFRLQAMRLKNASVQVLTVGVGNATDEVELRDIIASSPADYTRVESFVNLAQNLDIILTRVGGASLLGHLLR